MKCKIQSNPESTRKGHAHRVQLRHFLGPARNTIPFAFVAASTFCLSHPNDSSLSRTRNIENGTDVFIKHILRKRNQVHTEHLLHRIQPERLYACKNDIEMNTVAEQTTQLESRRRRRPSAQLAPRVPEREDSGVPDAASDDDDSLLSASPCEACPYCPDTCGDESCKLCAHKECSEISTPTCPSKRGEPTFTLCQVRRHCTAESVWIVAGTDIYDVTAYIDSHPGGRRSIMRKAGGLGDCTDDIKFHTKAGQRMWKKYRVGTLVPCPGDPTQQEKPWWQFWGRSGG